MTNTVDKRKHCKVPQPPPYIFGYGRLLHALNPTLQCFLVSTVFDTVSSLHLTSFLMIFTLVYIGMVNVYCAKKEKKMVGVVDYYARL